MWDVETRPHIAYSFQTFKAFISMDQIIEPARVICFSAQWYGSKTPIFFSEHHDDRGTMLSELHKLLDEADVVVTYNGKAFDVPWVEGEFIAEGMLPPSPYFHVDLYQVVRSRTRWPSKKLDYLSLRLLDDRKVHHTGFQLWLDCMAGDAKAWALMKKYSIKDTQLMVPLYERLRPWVKNHPNVGRGEFTCPRCGSGEVQRRGHQVTVHTKYDRFQCQVCGGWSRSKSADKMLPDKEQVSNLRGVQ